MKQVQMFGMCDFCQRPVHIIARSKAEAKRWRDAYIVCSAPQCEAKHQARLVEVVKSALAR